MAKKTTNKSENKGWCAIIGLIVKELAEVAYQYLSLKVLKPYCGIETPFYKKWWMKRSYRIQMALDTAHDTDFARINYPDLYYGKH